MNDRNDVKASTPTADNIRAIVEVERRLEHEATGGERFGQWLTDHIGTMSFVVWHSAFMGVWVVWNSALSRWAFDPYPFGLLTFIVSLEGVLIATFVLIAQNRMSRQTDQRDHLNLQISMLAEQEMTLLLKLVRRIAERLDVRPESDVDRRAADLAEDTNVYELVEEIRRELPDNDERSG